MVRKTVISQLQSVGEGAIGKLAQNPATRNAVQGAMQVKERGERILHLIESIEKRLAAIEKRLSSLEAGAKGTRARTTATRSSSTARGSRASTRKTGSS